MNDHGCCEEVDREWVVTLINPFRGKQGIVGISVPFKHSILAVVEQVRRTVR